MIFTRAFPEVSAYHTPEEMTQPERHISIFLLLFYDNDKKKLPVASLHTIVCSHILCVIAVMLVLTMLRGLAQHCTLWTVSCIQ